MSQGHLSPPRTPSLPLSVLPALTVSHTGAVSHLPLTPCFLTQPPPRRETKLLWKVSGEFPHAHRPHRAPAAGTGVPVLLSKPWLFSVPQPFRSSEQALGPGLLSAHASLLPSTATGSHPVVLKYCEQPPLALTTNPVVCSTPSQECSVHGGGRVPRTN